VRYVLRNLMRDWSVEGAAERAQSYGRITAELAPWLAARPPGAPPAAVLVPGAGLARLCCDIAALGAAAQGSEYSFFMLLASSFVLNGVERAGQFAVHPFATTPTNQRSDANQLRPISIPDVAPADLTAGPGLLSMCAGAFEEVYSGPQFAGAFDAVATCFFIDTARNVLAYLDAIWAALRPGGLWVNCGPLLWHWADSHTYLPAGELSVELPLDALLSAAAALGFELLKKEDGVAAAYMADPLSMHKTVYDAVFFVMRKPAGADDGGRRGSGEAGGGRTPTRPPQTL